MTTAAGTRITDAATIEDRRRITEHDPDITRLRSQTYARLSRSVATLVADLRRDPVHMQSAAQSRFIQRHVAILTGAYTQAHHQGALDYYEAVSQRPGRYARQVDVHPQTLRKRLGFYAPSVAKLAHEALLAWQKTQVQRLLGEGEPQRRSGDRNEPASTDFKSAILRHADSDCAGRVTPSLDDAGTDSIALDDGDALDTWQNGLGARLTLQADLTWSGAQDGYLDGGASDGANPYGLVNWNLEPLAQHCDDCPVMAAGSPYGAPGSGNNELNNTPGDGSTSCGAACKCDLEYAPSETHPPANWPAFFPPDAPISAIQPIAPPPSTQLTPAQQHALDLYRDVEDAWNAVGGEQAALPPLFAEWLVNGGWQSLVVPGWDNLTPQQQDIYERLAKALTAWVEATNAADVEQEQGQ